MLSAHHAIWSNHMGNSITGKVALMPVLQLFIWYSATCCAIFFMPTWVDEFIHTYMYMYIHVMGFTVRSHSQKRYSNIIFVQSRGHCLSCIYTSWYRPGLSLHKHGNQQNCYYVNYHKISNIRRTESQHLNDSHLVLQLSVPNPLKPGAKPRMKM